MKPPSWRGSGSHPRCGTRYIISRRLPRQAVRRLPIIPVKLIRQVRWCSVVAADGALWPEPEPGDSFESKPVPGRYVPSLRSFCSNHRSRGASGPVGPPGKGARRATPQSLSHALHQQGQELVCPFIRGQCFLWVAFVSELPFVQIPLGTHQLSPNQSSPAHPHCADGTERSSSFPTRIDP